ncbi:hypothetical protein [Actinokineospora enzanensis]|uniref:hypothetical protein n=1 Tax=Actinokineospora enzanensis TaxID=155975 RepID=UPI0003738BF3|nr:hypothetical protein [Actinokineospora enzanensis]
MGNDFETARDTITEATSAAGDHLGRIVMIVAGAVRDIATEIGDWAGEVVDLADKSRRAAADHEPAAPDTDA